MSHTNGILNGFILAAGLGTRFRPLTLKTPKPLIKINGKEVIVYSLELMKKNGVQEVVINTHHLHGVIEKRLGDGSEWGLKIKYSYEPELLGTAGGFKKASSLFESPGTTVVLSSDIITNAPISKLLEHHFKKKSEVTIAVTERDDVTGTGIVGFDEDNRIHRFLEKPTQADQIFSHWINCSLYVFEPQVIDMIPSEMMYDFSMNLFSELIEQNRLFYAYPLPEDQKYLIGIDRMELRDQAEKDIISGKLFYEQ